MFQKIKNFPISIITLTIIIIITLLISDIETRKRKPKEKKKVKKVYNPRDKKPSRLSDELYCQICKDIVRETAKNLYGKKRDYEVIDAIEKTCDSQSMYPIRKKRIFYLVFKN